MKKILVTGAKGMLGQDLCPLLRSNGYTVIETDQNNLNITNFNQAEYVIKYYQPSFVIHCAAYTNVDKAEEDRKTAQKINEKGTQNIAKICAEFDIPVVYISTDYVFDGEAQKPYPPRAKRNPLNFYGLTKAKGEDAIQKYCRNFYIARTSWLYGHKGRNFVETMLELAKTKEEIKVVDDQIGCPTWSLDFAKGILNLIKEEKPYGVYNICGSGQTSWYGFAVEIFKKAGVKTKLTPCKTEEFPRPAKRPKFSAMENDGSCRDWKEALSDYFKYRNITEEQREELFTAK